jgi:hypothetical protein
MKKTIFKGKYKDHDLTVRVNDSKVVDGLIGAIEKAALAQVPLSPRLLQQFYELRDVGFFIPHEGVTWPETGGIEPCGWLFGDYSLKIFASVKIDSPRWIVSVSQSNDPKKLFNNFVGKWARLDLDAAGENSYYHLRKLIHNEVTKNGTISINGYQALTPMEVLEKILPDKYKAKKAS